jgi:hypothetical protein
MKSKLVVIALTIYVSTHYTANAGDFGTPDDARAMLNRAVIVINDNEQNALQEFIKGEDTFKDRDLYVFCASEDHKVSAHPNVSLIGKSTKDIKDANGKAFIEDMITIAEPGKVSEVNYAYPRFGNTKPLPKVTFVTKVKDQVCGVGYYREP